MTDVHTVRTTLTSDELESLGESHGPGVPIIIPLRRPLSPDNVWSGDGMVLLTADGVTYLGTVEDNEGDRELFITLR